MQEPLLEVTGVSKKYARSLRRSLDYGVRDVVSQIFNRKRELELRTDEFWALRDVSFSLARGECLAVLGANGAGKSTLLKLLSGMLLPDGGFVIKRGRMEKMIELSAGFSPNLSGRENVELKARLLGLSAAELGRRFDDLVTFAELEEFIDTPVQFYSSGMRARLGFALSVVMQPDILLIDEVLAVGDLGFRMKCYARVDQMRQNAAVVLVTHGMNHVARMATSSLVLHKGHVVHLGATQDGIAKYQEISGFSKPAKDPAFNADLVDFTLLSNEKEVAQESTVDYGADIRLVGAHFVSYPLALSIVVQESGGNAVADWNSRRADFVVSSGESFEVGLGQVNLCPGFYQLCVVGFAADGTQRFLSRPLRFQVRGVFLGATRYQPVGAWLKRGNTSPPATLASASSTRTTV